MAGSQTPLPFDFSSLRAKRTLKIRRKGNVFDFAQWRKQIQRRAKRRRKMVSLTEHQRGIADAKLMMAVEEAAQNGSFWEIYVDKSIKKVLEHVKIDASEASKEQYRSLYKSKNYSNGGKSWQRILLTCNTRASFDKTRTAFRFCIAEEIQGLRKQADKFSKAKDYDKARALTKEAFFLSVKFEDEFLSQNKITFKDLKDRHGYEYKSLSKRKTAKKAPSADVVFSSMKDGFFNNHAVGFSIINRFGIRPSELQKGVKIQYKNERIFLIVKGSKVAADRGQEVRVVGYKPDLSNAADKILLDAINKSADGVLSVVQTKKQYDALRKHFNKYHPGFSLYSYRHAFASDLKKSGASRKEIAEALGHRNTVSQEFYGYSKQGSSARQFVAKAQNEVKIKPDIKQYVKQKTEAKPVAVASKRPAAAGATRTPPKLRPRGPK